MSKDYTINEAAKILGVHKDTIKYWEERNLIPRARRSIKNSPRHSYRIYNVDEIRAIAKIRGIYDVELDAAIHNFHIWERK
ncbi:MerR-family transcriptional regulator [Paenibacillus sp. TCA20]|uniref:MerR family transcriptional regulator n=1 Tax=Paenibacillus urinalis TaxID=521520 RepID=A0ABY7XKB6_9BACL|nr:MULTISPECIES: MerR family transcriptional regulator [Paenibacillus]WDI05216.1 MerR family transcriptional regulator [Paenibacillus urinalis]GAK41955.1 MerR-family transcriptional regulator [Paenibacillus sp. TCA20]